MKQSDGLIQAICRLEANIGCEDAEQWLSESLLIDYSELINTIDKKLHDRYLTYKTKERKNFEIKTEGKDVIMQESDIVSVKKIRKAV